MAAAAGQGAVEDQAPLPADRPLYGRLAWLAPWGPPLTRADLPKKKLRVAAVAGVTAGAAGLMATVLLRLMGAGAFVPEAAVDFAISVVPGSLEAAAISTMGGGAKVVALVVAILAFVAAHGVFALYFPRALRLLEAPWKAVVLFAAAPAAVTLLAVLPAFGKGVAGVDDAMGSAGATVGALAGSGIFAIVLHAAYDDLARKHPQGIDLTRRTAIQAAAVVLLAAALGGALLGGVAMRIGRLAFGSTAALLANEVTPTSAFYRVSKNTTDPAVDPSTWRLAVEGLVGSPRTHTSNELLARGQADEVVTLECVSNPVGGNLIGTARWQGVPLAQLIDEAGPAPAATWVVFECADGYDVGVPLIKARAPGALVALHMNGERLPREHGFPARVLVPGLFGMMNAKWVERVRLVDQPFKGFWQRKGWTNEGAIRTTAIIAVAPSQTPRGVPVEVGGVAFAGDRPIERVEVSDDGGATWTAAATRAPLSPYAWTLWTYTWTPASAGFVRLHVRAVESGASGEVVQTRAVQGPFPDGATGYDSVEVTVSG